MFKEVVGERALGLQGVGGDRLAAEVQRLKDRDDPPDLMGLLDFVAARYGQGADIFWDSHPADARAGCRLIRW